MRPIAFHGVGLAAIASLLFLGISSVGAEEAADATPVDWTVRAIEAWGKTCRTCHAVPDTKFATDRAFLRQIMVTT